MLRILTEPDAFFEQRARKPGLKSPLFILLIVGVAFALDMFLVYANLGRAEFDYGPTALMLAFLYAFVPLFLWLSYGGVAFFLARMFGARGRLGNVLRVTAYGYLPMGVGATLWSVARYAVIDADPCNMDAFRCGAVSAPTIPAQAEAIFEFASQANGEPLFQAAFAVGMVLTLGSLFLWWRAIDESTTLEARQAAVAAVVPYVGLVAAFLIIYL